jgi:hypothetical protein
MKLKKKISIEIPFQCTKIAIKKNEDDKIIKK